jgi:hypothetical protein
VQHMANAHTETRRTDFFIQTILMNYKRYRLMATTKTINYYAQAQKINEATFMCMVTIKKRRTDNFAYCIVMLSLQKDQL